MEQSRLTFRDDNEQLEVIAKVMTVTLKAEQNRIQNITTEYRILQQNITVPSQRHLYWLQTVSCRESSQREHCCQTYLIVWVRLPEEA